jgi:flagellar basal body-associated protein FliL
MIVDAHDPNHAKWVALIVCLIAFFVLVVLGVVTYLVYFRHKKPSNKEIELQQVGGGNDTTEQTENLSFVQRHLATLRAWTKPATADKGKAPVTTYKPPTIPAPKKYFTNRREYEEKQAEMRREAAAFVESLAGPSGTTTNR